MYQIRYHKLLVKDFLKIPKKDHRKIYLAIQKKLKNNPKVFGKPLKNELKGYFRLRIMHYRLIYEIKEKEVMVCILHIGQRKDLSAYMESAKRLK